MVEGLVAGGLSLAGGWLGAYLGAYLKKKGENLATHEDIDKLVDQVRAVTQTTKEIEAKISDEVWNRQKRWEIKRDAIFEVVRALGDLEVALGRLISIYRVSVGKEQLEAYVQAKNKENGEYQEAYRSFQRAKALVILVSSEKIKAAFNHFGVSLTQLTDDIVNSRMEKANRDFSSVTREGLDLREMLRQELLGVEQEQKAAKAVAGQSSI